MSSSRDAVACESRAESPPTLSTSSTTCETAADRGLFYALKYRNYCQFIQSIANYMQIVQPWASSLRLMPLCGFQLQVEVKFGGAIDAHQHGDNEGRDRLARATVRHTASEYGIDLSKLHADDYVKLLRYDSFRPVYITHRTRTSAAIRIRAFATDQYGSLW